MHIDAARDNYDLLAQLWGDFKHVIEMPPNAQQALKLAELNEEVVWIGQKGEQILLKSANTARNRFTLQVAVERELSQRLAKLYLLQVWGADTEAIRNDLNFADALQVPLDRKRPERNALENVATTSDRVLEVLDDLLAAK